MTPGPFGSGKAYVRCQFDGVERSCFVDTGSVMSLLAPSNAFLKRPTSGSFKFKSASGVVHEAEVLEIEAVRLDGINMGSVRLGRLARVGSENVLGMDILGRSAFRMVFRTAPKLELRAHPKGGVLRPLEVSTQGLMAIPVSFGGNEALGVWDTGASVTAVDTEFVRRNPGVFKRQRTGVEGVDGTGEVVELELYRANELMIGNRRFKNLYAVALDLGALRAGPWRHREIGRGK